MLITNSRWGGVLLGVLACSIWPAAVAWADGNEPTGDSPKLGSPSFFGSGVSRSKPTPGTPPPPPAVARDPAVFFDGQSLAGWRTEHEGWSVMDGAIRFSGKLPATGLSSALTKPDWSRNPTFRLTFEARGNVKSLGATIGGFDRAAEVVDPDQWHEFQIDWDGAGVVVTVDGKASPKAAIALSAFLFTVEGQPGESAKAEFRNISMGPLQQALAAAKAATLSNPVSANPNPPDPGDRPSKPPPKPRAGVVKPPAVATVKTKTKSRAELLKLSHQDLLDESSRLEKELNLARGGEMKALDDRLRFLRGERPCENWDITEGGKYVNIAPACEIKHRYSGNMAFMASGGNNMLTDGSTANGFSCEQPIQFSFTLPADSGNVSKIIVYGNYDWPMIYDMVTRTQQELAIPINHPISKGWLSVDRKQVGKLNGLDFRQFKEFPIAPAKVREIQLAIEDAPPCAKISEVVILAANPNARQRADVSALSDDQLVDRIEALAKDLATPMPAGNEPPAFAASRKQMIEREIAALEKNQKDPSEGGKYFNATSACNIRIEFADKSAFNSGFYTPTTYLARYLYDEHLYNGIHTDKPVAISLALPSAPQVKGYKVIVWGGTDNVPMVIRRPVGGAGADPQPPPGWVAPAAAAGEGFVSVNGQKVGELNSLGPSQAKEFDITKSGVCREVRVVVTKGIANCTIGEVAILVERPATPGKPTTQPAGAATSPPAKPAAPGD